MFKRKRRGASTKTRKSHKQWWHVWGPRLSWLGGLVALIGMGAVVYEASQRLFDPARYPLRHVHLEGNLNYLDEAQMQTMAAVYLGKSFFLMDIQALGQDFSAHPWIEQISVQRRWPDILRVQFRERIPFALWGKDEMVDVQGERFQPELIPEAEWPTLLGPDGHEQVLIKAYKEASGLLAKVDLKITHLVQDQRRAWRLTLNNGVEVNLGREAFKPRLQRFVELYPQVLAERITQVASVDLRYINGFAVRWKKSVGSTG